MVLKVPQYRRGDIMCFVLYFRAWPFERNRIDIPLKNPGKEKSKDLQEKNAQKKRDKDEKTETNESAGKES